MKAVSMLCILAITPALMWGQTVKATATVNPTKGNTVHGVVNFEETRDGLHIVADLEGLTPGEHGFHIHEFGDCSASDATSAGGHFNPTGKQHGSPDSDDHHIGDLGNINALSNGKAHYDRTIKGISLNGPNAIVGKSMVVHAKKDDFKSQPAGDAGSRIGCGVIVADQN